MKHLAGVRSLALIAAVFGAVMLILWLAVSQSFAELLVPSPEMTAAQLVKALKAHRYEGATAQLSQSLRRDVDEEKLRGLVRGIEQQRGGIVDAQERGSEIQGDAAIARVAVRTDDGREPESRSPSEKSRASGGSPPSIRWH